MSIELKTVYQLVDGVLNEGLSFVGLYLERYLSSFVVITDNYRQIHYPDLTAHSPDVDTIFATFPHNLVQDQYYYQKETKMFYYHLKFNDNSAYLIVKDLPGNNVPFAVSLVNETKLAIKCYFANLSIIPKNKTNLEKELTQYLSFQSNLNICDILKKYDKKIQLDKKHYVEIMKIVNPNENKLMIDSFVRKYLRNVNSEIMIVMMPDSITLIIPAPLVRNLSKINVNRPPLFDSSALRKIMLNQFNIITNFGRGQEYPLSDILSSYREARIAISLPSLIGENNFIQQFSQLGMFYQIFSQDLDNLKIYSLHTLGEILEYDKKNGSDLLETLRKFLDSSFNWKVTADNLFIHVNTLHYRLERIEKLINADLSKMDVCTNLFIAIKVWDVLNMLEI